MNMYEAESIDIDLVEQDKIRDANRLKRYRLALEKIASIKLERDCDPYDQLITVRAMATKALK